MNEKFDELINGYVNDKVGVCGQFLSKELATLLRQDLIDLDNQNLMQPAGIGNTVKDHLQKKRGDKIHWIEKQDNKPNELAFLAQVDAFISYLNQTCYTGINAYEFHYALYEAGSYYHRHRDQFQNNDSRKYSLINYLNDDWTAADGGALMVYDGDKTDTILPNIQKAVFFKSNETEHEVAIAHRPRMSITGWLKVV